ncbi:hypothetical protein, partial [Bacteroides pyogenes]|uniref:hypothetical protein n=1 Tax=Bacteroides pyogenes TaxID=310300 RepID=UPI0005868333
LPCFFRGEGSVSRSRLLLHSVFCPASSVAKALFHTHRGSVWSNRRLRLQQAEPLSGFGGAAFRNRLTPGTFGAETQTSVPCMEKRSVPFVKFA